MAFDWVKDWAEVMVEEMALALSATL